MPKVQENTYSCLHSYISEFGSSVFLIDKTVLFCKLCKIEFSTDKYFTVLQHLKTEKQIWSVNRIDKPNKVNNLNLMCRPKNPDTSF